MQKLRKKEEELESVRMFLPVCLSIVLTAMCTTILWQYAVNSELKEELRLQGDTLLACSLKASDNKVTVDACTEVLDAHFILMKEIPYNEG